MKNKADEYRRRILDSGKSFRKVSSSIAKSAVASSKRDALHKK